jgi:fluoroacetyl-CoA thioesterase
MNIAVGESAEAEIVVQPSDTASALGLSPQDAFPDVFATSRMVALMEVAAARLLRPVLGPGELSVGVTLSVRHTAATPVGGRVRAVASYLGLEGKMHRFRVEAFDDAGSVGEGEHLRAIVSTERLLAGAARRRPPTDAAN